MGPGSNIDRGMVYPPVMERVDKLLQACAARGVTARVVSGFRTWEEQQKLFDAGRKTPGATLTNAPPGWSPHNYGLAVDFESDDYAVLAEEAVKAGLDSGMYWCDPKHVQFPLNLLGIKWLTLIALYKDGGLSAVWRYLDRFRW